MKKLKDMDQGRIKNKLIDIYAAMRKMRIPLPHGTSMPNLEDFEPS